jgi:hypothetical protein
VRNDAEFVISEGHLLRTPDPKRTFFDGGDTNKRCQNPIAIARNMQPSSLFGSLNILTALKVPDFLNAQNSCAGKIETLGEL